MDERDLYIISLKNKSVLYSIKTHDEFISNAYKIYGKHIIKILFNREVFYPEDIYFCGSFIDRIVRGNIDSKEYYDSDVDIIFTEDFTEYYEYLIKNLSKKFDIRIEVNKKMRKKICVSAKGSVCANVALRQKIISVDLFQIKGEIFNCIKHFHLPCVRAIYNPCYKSLLCYMSFIRSVKLNLIYNIYGRLHIGKIKIIDIYLKYFKRGLSCMFNKTDFYKFKKYLKNKKIKFTHRIIKNK